MINSTILLQEVPKFTDDFSLVTYLSNNIFLPSVAAYWVIQFLLTMIIGYALVKEDKANFFAIFILTQFIGAIILFFIFVYPIIPGWIDNLLN